MGLTSCKHANTAAPVTRHHTTVLRLRICRVRRAMHWDMSARRPLIAVVSMDAARCKVKVRLGLAGENNTSIMPFWCYNRRPRDVTRGSPWVR